MKSALKIEGEITEDGHLLVELPPQVERGPVLVTLEPVPEEPFDLSEDDLKGQGLTAAEIARSPEFGAWADAGLPSGAEYIDELRRRSRRYSW